MKMLKPRIGMTLRTGDKCRQSGVWKVVGTADGKTVSVSRGNRMPQDDGRNVSWRLIISFGK